MQTYRIRSATFPQPVLLKARTSEEATLFGALFYLCNGLVDDLRGPFTPEPWDAIVDAGECVPHEYFDGIVPELVALITAAQATAVSTERAGELNDSGPLTMHWVMNNEGFT